MQCNMSECVISGCRKFVTKCTECGHVVSTAEFEAPGWISVEDRLPEEWENVLGWDEERTREVTMHLIYADEDFELQLASWNSGQWPIPGITHWMPMPKGPSTNK